jgi:hypothetical protein
MTNRIIERKHPIIEIFEIDAGKLIYLLLLEMFNNLAMKMLTALILQITYTETRVLSSTDFRKALPNAT